MNHKDFQLPLDKKYMYLYKQFLKMYISTLLVSPKLPGFILEQHPTYSLFSWLSKSRRNIKTLLLTAMHLSRLLYSQTKPIWERANKTTKNFHPKTDGQSSFFPFIVIPLSKCLWHQKSTNTTHNQFYPAEKTHF